MKTSRWLVVVSTLVGSLAAVPAAEAAGRAPAGNGLVALTQQDDITITNLDCGDETITEMQAPRGGLAGWVLGEPDRMYVLTSVSGEGTATTPDGSSDYTFSESYGNKAGLGETVHCSMDYEFAYGDVTDSGKMHVTLAPIW